MRRAFFLAILLLGTNGCAIIMAMQGKEEPDMTMVEVGSTRGQIEMQLGTPMESTPAELGGSVDTYQIEMGNEPSPGRAVLHGAVDILTLFFWEPIGTLIESMQGEIKYIQIEYDENDYATMIRNIDPPAEPEESDEDS